MLRIDASLSMTKRFARLLLHAQAVLLLIGTLMPGSWREALQDASHSPFGLSSWAHFALFACMSAVALLPPLRWSSLQVVLVGLALALLSEGLQFFAIERHPRWLDVGIDMAGLLAGSALARGVDWLRSGQGESY